MSGVPLNSSYEHSLYFSYPEEQEYYFYNQSLTNGKTFNNFTYLRPGNVIKVAGDVANARTWNYLYFSNDIGKVYYHFIDKVVYVSDSVVELHITLDVIQTYMFDWDLKPCFIERTHVKSDQFGEHTVPEGLETGPLVEQHRVDIDLHNNCILMLMACDKNGNDARGKMYGGVYSGLKAYAVDPKDVAQLNLWFAGASQGGYIDAVNAIWMYPKDLVVISGTWDDGNALHEVTSVNEDKTVTIDDYFYNRTDIDGLTMRNRKSFCYPYTMLYVSNNMGGCATLRRELFDKNTKGKFQFYLEGALSPDAGVDMIPHYYKGASSNFEEALSLPAFPSCSWISDTYLVWLAQNQNSQALAQKQAVIQAGVGAATAVGSIFSGNIGGAVGGLSSTYSALNNVQSLMAQKADMAIQPDQARGNHSGSINLTHYRMGFTAYFMSVTHEYAMKIDDYFTRYGYQVNTIDVPSIKNRELFTYIKTAGCLATNKPGKALGAEDQLKIQAIFDRGITFWTDPKQFGSYYNPNRPLSEVT